MAGNEICQCTGCCHEDCFGCQVEIATSFALAMTEPGGDSLCFPLTQLQRFVIQQECHLMKMRFLEAMPEIKFFGRLG